MKGPPQLSLDIVVQSWFGLSYNFDNRNDKPLNNNLHCKQYNCPFTKHTGRLTIKCKENHGANVCSMMTSFLKL